MKQFNKKNKSFTLIEVIIAIFLLTAGTFGAYTVIQQAVITASFSTSKLTAAYLAQEGIEIVRNIRDTNWLEDRTTTTPWDDGLGAGNWEADYQTQNLTDDYDGDYLNIDTDGFYSYSSGTMTKFKRKITITSGANLEVLVEVSWQEGSTLQNVSVQENLYNWR